jgi:hypothetical protein
MIKNYSEFILENVQKSKAIYKQKLEDYEKLKKKLELANRLGWMGKFTELLFSNVPYNELEALFNSLEDLKKKNIPINIDSYNNYESLLDDIDKKLNFHRFKLVINKFPKKQKDLVLNWLSNPEKLSQNSLSFIKLGEAENNEIFFRAISSYETYSDLYQSLQRFLKSRGKQYTREYVKSLLDDDLILRYEDDRFIILETKTHPSICKVGDDTSWCIVRSASQFGSYTKDGRKQFVLIDYTKENFDKLYKIGFTLSVDNKILYAHDVIDGSVIPYIKDLLTSNKIEVESLNVKEIINIDLLKSLPFTKAVTYLEKLPLIEKNKLGEVISEFSKKVPLSNFTIGMRVIQNLFKRYLDVTFISEKDFDKYKNWFNQSPVANWKRVKESFIESTFVITPKPVHDVMKYPLEAHRLYHKDWKFKIDDDKAISIILGNTNKEWCEILLHYLDKLENLTDYQNLLKLYCKMTLGEEISKSIVKDIIDEYSTKSTQNWISPTTYLKLMNIFRIKYKITEKLLRVDYAIDWNLVDKTPAKLRITRSDELFYSIKKDILDKKGIDYYYEIKSEEFLSFLNNITLKAKKQIEFTKIYTARRSNESYWIEEFLIYVEKNRKGEIKFKDGVKFPLQIQYQVGEKSIPITIVESESNQSSVKENRIYYKKFKRNF